jgi:hypothetical protein
MPVPQPHPSPPSHVAVSRRKHGAASQRGAVALCGGGCRHREGACVHARALVSAAARSQAPHLAPRTCQTHGLDAASTRVITGCSLLPSGTTGAEISASITVLVSHAASASPADYHRRAAAQRTLCVLEAGAACSRRVAEEASLGTAPRLRSAKTLAEYLRVLRPDGTLVLEEPGAAQARASRRTLASSERRRDEFRVVACGALAPAPGRLAHAPAAACRLAGRDTA